MTETAAETETRVRAEVPQVYEDVDGRRVPVSDEEYERFIAGMVAAEQSPLAGERKAQQTKRQVTRQQVKAALAALEDPVTAANVQQRLVQTRTILSGLIQVLIDLQLVERDP